VARHLHASKSGPFLTFSGLVTLLLAITYVLSTQMGHATLLHIMFFCEGPNKKSKGFAKEKQKT
jgi:hypothetical protein